MNPSIRKYLLINILISLTLTIIITGIGNYYLEKRDITSHTDATLSRTAYIFQALLSNDLAKRNIKELQSSINSVPKENVQILQQVTKNRFLLNHEAYQFQVWDKNGKLILHSKNYTDKKLAPGKAGFSTLYLDQEIPWRVFTLYNKKNDLIIMVAERSDSATNLSKRLTNDYLSVILLAYPLLGLLIWIIIGKALGSVKRVTDEVAHRAPSFLEPVNIQAVPSEVRPLVEELNKLLLRLKNALEREKRFAGDAAHELKTPLAAVKTQAQVALRAKDKNAQKTALQYVVASVDRSTHIVEQLLILNRLNPTAHSIEDLSIVNLSTLVPEVIAQIAPQAIDKQIDIEFINKTPNVEILSNPAALSILTRNLVDNAIRYTPKGGTVKVYVFKQKKQSVISVHDTGPGIPAKYRARVFERFFRVLGNTAPGSGLGLSIVQQIANIYSATVSLGAPTTGTGLIVEVCFSADRSR